MSRVEDNPPNPISAVQPIRRLGPSPGRRELARLPGAGGTVAPPLHGRRESVGSILLGLPGAAHLAPQPLHQIQNTQNIQIPTSRRPSREGHLPPRGRGAADLSNHLDLRLDGAVCKTGTFPLPLASAFG
jgi:hypothetical protein